MGAGDRYFESKGRRRKRKSRTGLSRSTLGLRPQDKDWKPGPAAKRNRYRKAAEAGYSEIERNIIANAPFKLDGIRFARVLEVRKDQVKEYARRTGRPIPGSLEWRLYWRGKADEDILKRIKSWERSAEAIDELYGHQTIFDIYYEGKETVLYG